MKFGARALRLTIHWEHVALWCQIPKPAQRQPGEKTFRELFRKALSKQSAELLEQLDAEGISVHYHSQEGFQEVHLASERRNISLAFAAKAGG